MNTQVGTWFLSAGIFLAVLTTGLGQPTITKQPSNQTASLFADTTFMSSEATPAITTWL